MANHPDLLFQARLAIVVVGLLLGLGIFAWSKQLHGWTGGLFSLAIFSLSPNLIAHARLVTADLCLAAFGFIAVYFHRKGVTGSSRKRDIVLSGVFLGLALLSKYSGLLWLPALAIAAASARRSVRFTASGLVATFGVAFSIVLLGYGFALDEFLRGLYLQSSLVGTGSEPSFLMGKISYQGWWHYYLVGLLIKLPIPMLVFVLARSVLAGVRRDVRLVDAAFLMVPVVVFLGTFSTFATVNSGIRYVLPILPFLMVWIGGLPAALPDRPAPRRIGTSVMALLLAWYAYGGLSIHPHHLAYFNELIGGPEQGHRYLLDSNLDWGQDLPGLKTYMDTNGIDEIKLSYFGTADPALYGIEYRALSSNAPLDPARAFRRIEPGDVLAISATNLHPVFVDLGELGRRLRGRTPLATVGHSIFIYRAEQVWRSGGVRQQP